MLIAAGDRVEIREAGPGRRTLDLAYYLRACATVSSD
jgi:hypothetical protein